MPVVLVLVMVVVSDEHAHRRGAGLARMTDVSQATLNRVLLALQ